MLGLGVKHVVGLGLWLGVVVGLEQGPVLDSGGNLGREDRGGARGARRRLRSYSGEEWTSRGSEGKLLEPGREAGRGVSEEGGYKGNSTNLPRGSSYRNTYCSQLNNLVGGL